MGFSAGDNESVWECKESYAGLMTAQDLRPSLAPCARYVVFLRLTACVVVQLSRHVVSADEYYNSELHVHFNFLLIF